MSSFLYRMGRAIVRRRGRVLAVWFAALALVGAAAGLLTQGTEDSFELPGAESQEALNHLNNVFPQMSGAQAQIVAAAPDGQTIDSPEHRQAIDSTLERLKDLPQVEAAMSPFDNGGSGISDDRGAAMTMVQMNADQTHVTPETKAQLTQIADDLRQELGAGSEAHAGGDVFAVNVPALGVTEVMGVVVALMVLLLMFRSVIAATMPLLTAIVGVGVSMGLAFAATSFITLSSAAPLLAVMLGLAVGIDYALFILSRHRDQLADGVEVEESIARAVATAGSAVVFAGLTVIIALLALAVPGLPFLTTMGQVAAVSVALAVLVALTLIPALLGFAGTRMRPGGRRKQRKQARQQHEQTRQRKPFSLRWVRAVTKFPVLTIVLVVLGLGICTLPAKDLQLALPDNGTKDPGTPARETYDAIDEHFGPGYNSPMVVTADIIGSKDPLGLVNGIADEIRQLPGVAAVPMATPNETIDTGIVQIFPTTSADSPETQKLVEQLRGMEGHFKQKYGSDTAVTGMTAVQIDLSSKLGSSLLPFGVIVVGLSLVLLAMLFRSVWVPIKAAVGYLLSIGAAFGATVFVFGQGHLAGLLNVTHVGSIISFLPIVLMGVLFGLAMDYEVFLVSRIREDYTHHRDARRAVESGFVTASRVVVAAAIIMFSVFAAFVPNGDSQIKPIAFALAVGVFVDAFIVRMVLVPAVLALLGDRAWKLPRWLDRKLPQLDVEGSALVREIQLADWPGPGADEAVSASQLRLDDDRDRPVVSGVNIHLRRGGVLAVHGNRPCGKTALLYALGGRVKQLSGDLKVLDRMLPQHRGAVRSQVALIPCATSEKPDEDLDAALADGVQLVLVDDLDQVINARRREAIQRRMRSATTAADGSAQRTSFVVTCQDPVPLSDLLPEEALTLALTAEPDPREQTARPVEV